jgi:hypothetical protein
MDEFRLLLLKRRAEDADRLEERLKRLEWSGIRVLYDDRSWLRRLVHPSRPLTGNCCPVCQGTPVYGHTGDCWLGLELRPRLPGR